MDDSVLRAAEAAKDPAGYPVLTYVWVLGLSTIGGIVNFSRKIREGHARPFNVAELLGELLTAAFAGLITFYLCEATTISGPMQAVFVGISGHMGSRAIFLIENWASKKWGS